MENYNVRLKIAWSDAIFFAVVAIESANAFTRISLYLESNVLQLYPES